MEHDRTTEKAEVFLYGAYCVMFGFYLHILRTCGMARHRFLTGSTISLFVLSTVHCVLELAIAVVFSAAHAVTGTEASRRYQKVYVSLILATNVVYVTSNVVADSIFIFRCYAIWNFRHKIIIFPMILTLAVAGLGYSTCLLYSPGVYDPLKLQSTIFLLSIGMSLLTTFVLMGLTVGRIWWLAREAGHIVGQKVAKRYYTVCAMILESGAIYGVGGIIFVAGAHATFDSTLSGTILGQLVGIAPTIIAVRVGLGYNVDKVDSIIATRPRVRLPPQLNPGAPQVQPPEEPVLLHIGGGSV
ncbi:hypothetical protein FB451DRAFT_1215842 [Mycena latifolia]|nr:hypothetical protein FB451DRAFT_1215842 [Mycena latifolia]